MFPRPVRDSQRGSDMCQPTKKAFYSSEHTRGNTANCPFSILETVNGILQGQPSTWAWPAV